MVFICPECGSIAEYNAYYGRVVCTSCTWESEKCEESDGGKVVNKNLSER